jgi:hypothetical protein
MRRRVEQSPLQDLPGGKEQVTFDVRYGLSAWRATEISCSDPSLATVSTAYPAPQLLPFFADALAYAFALDLPVVESHAGERSLMI